MTLAWKQILAAAMIGVVVGAVGAHRIAPCYFHRPWGHRDFQARLLERFSSKLKLTAEQRTQVAAILDVKRQKIDALRAEIQPRFKEIRASTAAEIRQLLTLEQQQKFDIMNAEFEAKSKRHWRKER